MRIEKQNNKKTVLIAIAILLAVTCGIATYLLYARNKEATPKTRAESDLSQAAELAKKPENKSVSPNTDQPSPPVKNETSGKKTIPMVASANIANGILYVRGGLNYQVPEEGGLCYANLTSQTGEVIKKDTEILQNPASADCKTISVPTSELPSGTLKIVLKYTSTNYEGTSNEVEVPVN